MKYVFYIILCGALITCAFISCKKYSDPKAVQDPRLNKPYCNDPLAVNYNWDFPGKPDNSVCFYSTDLYKGVYFFRDSVAFRSSGLGIYRDSFTLTITRLTDSTMAVTGFCGSGNALKLTARKYFPATLDTLVKSADSLAMGQLFCRSVDTVNGTFERDKINDSIIYISLQVFSDTGVVTTHTGSARRIQ